MRRLCALAACLILVAGCASDGPHWYDAALKDARGDNMEMRGLGTGPDLPRGRMRPPSEDRE